MWFEPYSLDSHSNLIIYLFIYLLFVLLRPGGRSKLISNNIQ